MSIGEPLYRIISSEMLNNLAIYPCGGTRLVVPPHFYEILMQTCLNIVVWHIYIHRHLNLRTLFYFPPYTTTAVHDMMSKRCLFGR